MTNARYQDRLKKLIENNKAFAQKWSNGPDMSVRRVQVRAAGGAILILTCLDPRCVPEQYFGPDLNAGVIRNAGGRVTPDVLRSVLAIRELAEVAAVVVVHHTDCGVTYMSSEDIAAGGKTRTPSEQAVREIEAIENTDQGFGNFTTAEFEQAIRDDVLALRNLQSLEGVDILGMALDLETGLVSEIVA